MAQKKNNSPKPKKSAAKAKAKANKTISTSVSPPEEIQPETHPDPSMDLDALCHCCEMSLDTIKEAGIEWQELAAIYEHYERTKTALLNVQDTVARSLGQCTAVHSVRSRVKSSSHLIEKIIRKTRDEDRVISFANYSDQITDRIGVRALHLYKDEWAGINSFIHANWNLQETPKAYYREGDSRSLLEQFELAGCDLEKHPKGYRSVHYLITTQPGKVAISVEIQVRTLFEEG